MLKGINEVLGPFKLKTVICHGGHVATYGNQQARPGTANSSAKAEESGSVDLSGALVEFVNFDELNETVEFLFGILILVSLSSDSDSDLAGNVSDTVHPDVSVELSVDANILMRGHKYKDH